VAGGDWSQQCSMQLTCILVCTSVAPHTHTWQCARLDSRHMRRACVGTQQQTITHVGSFSLPGHQTAIIMFHYTAWVLTWIRGYSVTTAVDTAMRCTYTPSNATEHRPSETDSAQLVKKLPVSYGTRMFTTEFMTASHWQYRVSRSS
jgi:GrpB-like predicted nucleotidyltransferase (UPF0157 family)